MSRRTIRPSCIALAVLISACGYRAGLVDESFSTEVAVWSMSRHGTVTGLPTRSIEIIGENFPADVEVLFGEVKAKVLETDPQRVLVEVPARGEPGVVEVRLVLPDGRSVSVSPFFRYRARELRLRFGEQLGSSGPEAAYGVGDVDGDGRNDLVIAAQRGQVGSLAIHLGTERGLALEPAYERTLPPALDYSSDSCFLLAQPKYDLAVADLDGDGRAEVAVTSHREDKLTLIDLKQGTWREQTVDSPALFDRCRARDLVPLDTDGKPGAELLVVLNHGEGDPPIGAGFVVSSVTAARPLMMGSIGYVAPGGGPSGVIAPKALGCQRLHSHHVWREAGKERLAVLCDRTTAAGAQELRLLELDLTLEEGHQVVSNRLMLGNVPSESRLYLHQLDGDQALEVLMLREQDAGRELLLARGELVTSGAGPVGVGPNGLTLDVDGGLTFDLVAQGPPILRVADVVGNGPEIVLLWPQRQGEMMTIDPRFPRAMECTDGRCGAPTQAGPPALLPHRAMMPPDWARTGPYGDPAMPTVAVGDLDGDGTPDWITTDRWRQTMVAYGGAHGPQALRPWRRLWRVLTHATGTSLWPAASLPATKDGLHRSALVDLDGDGWRDVVSLRMDFGAADGGVRMVLDLVRSGSEERRTSTDWAGGPTQEGHHHLEWTAGQATLLPAPAFGDLDGDGWTDLVFPTVEPGRGMRLDLVRSANGLKGYTVERAATEELGTITAVSVLSLRDVDRSPRSEGRAKARLFVASRRDVAAKDSPIDLHAFEWDAATQRLVRVDLGDAALDLRSDDVRQRGKTVRQIVQWQERDGRPVVQLNVDGGYCVFSTADAFEHPLRCRGCGKAGCVQRVFSQNDLVEQVFADPAAPDRLFWYTASQRGAFALDPHLGQLTGDAGTFLRPRVETACDLDGDGLPEVIFAAEHTGHGAPVIGALSWDINERRVSTRLVGLPAFAFEQVDCLQVDRAGPQDLVLRTSDNSYYLIHNQSR